MSRESKVVLSITYEMVGDSIVTYYYKKSKFPKYLPRVGEYFEMCGNYHLVEKILHGYNGTHKTIICKLGGKHE